MQKTQCKKPVQSNQQASYSYRTRKELGELAWEVNTVTIWATFLPFGDG